MKKPIPPDKWSFAFPDSDELTGWRKTADIVAILTRLCFVIGGIISGWSGWVFPFVLLIVFSWWLRYRELRGYIFARRAGYELSQDSS